MLICPPRDTWLQELSVVDMKGVRFVERCLSQCFGPLTAFILRALLSPSHSSGLRMTLFLRLGAPLGADTVCSTLSRKVLGVDAIKDKLAMTIQEPIADARFDAFESA